MAGWLTPPTAEFDSRRHRYVDEPAAEYDAYVEAGDPLAEAPTPPENPYRARVGRKDGTDVIAGTIRLGQLDATHVAIKATQLGISQNDLIVEAAERWVNSYPRTAEFNQVREERMHRDAQRCLLLGVSFTGPPPHRTPQSNRKVRTRNTPTTPRDAGLPSAEPETSLPAESLRP